MLAHIPIFDGSKKEEIFELLESSEAACLQSARDRITDALGRYKDSVKCCLFRIPVKKSWEDKREEINILRTYYSAIWKHRSESKQIIKNFCE